MLNQSIRKLTDLCLGNFEKIQRFKQLRKCRSQADHQSGTAKLKVVVAR